MYELRDDSHALIQANHRNINFENILSSGQLLYSENHHKALLNIGRDVILITLTKENFITSFTLYDNYENAYNYMMMMKEMEMKENKKIYNHDIIVIEWKLNHACKKYFGVERTPNNKKID